MKKINVWLYDPNGTCCRSIYIMVDSIEQLLKELERLSENKMVELDEERKAQMVSNLLVVLCGNHDAQPIVNTGSLY